MVVMVKTDSDIQRQVLDELDWDPEIEATEVGVEVDEGVATLTGSVDSYAKKFAAERAALRIDGVRAVANDLVVKWDGKLDDTDIAKAAANALEANVSVPRNAIDVIVKSGRVTLTGMVKWEYQRSAAANAIRYLGGVKEVINLITVQQPTVSEDEIKTSIDRALVRSAEVDAATIHVHTRGGHVTLTGTVRSWPEKRDAESAAWRAKGVTNVTNDIHIMPR